MSSIMDILNIPFGYLMRGLYFISGDNYLIALVFFAIVMKLVLLPFAIKQQKTQIKSASLRPKLAAIEKKYSGRNDKATVQKKNEEIMALQQKEGYSPLSGCLPLLLQMPIIIALYNVIRNPLTYICRLSSETINAVAEKVNELSGNAVYDVSKAINQISLIRDVKATGIDSFSDLLAGVKLPDFTVFGNFFDLSATPSFTPDNPSGYWLLLIPAITFVSYYFSMKLTRKLTSAAQATEMTREVAMSNKIMDFTMPLISVFFTFSLPAAIGVYWILQSLLSLLQTFILTKVMPFPTFTEEDYKAAEREYKVKSKGKNPAIGSSPNAGKVRSLHHIDDDDDETTFARSTYKDDDDDDAQAEIPSGEVKGGVESAPLKKDDRDKKN